MSDAVAAAPSADRLAEALNETDRRVLQTMVDDDHHTAPELATRLDASRAYLNTRLAHLETFGFVERVERGLYRIDEHGRTVAEEGKA